VKAMEHCVCEKKTKKKRKEKKSKKNVMYEADNYYDCGTDAI
jgi:hypothetical protein